MLFAADCPERKSGAVRLRLLRATSLREGNSTAQKPQDYRYGNQCPGCRPIEQTGHSQHRRCQRQHSQPCRRGQCQPLGACIQSHT